MAKTASWVFGAIFIIAGVWGFFTQPMAALGFIAADWFSSIVHVIVGIILLAMAGKPSAGKTLKSVGILYVIFAILGFVQKTKILFGMFATDMTTNWFYLVVGIVLAAIGFMTKNSGMSAPMSSSMPPTSMPPAPTPPSSAPSAPTPPSSAPQM